MGKRRNRTILAIIVLTVVAIGIILLCKPAEESKGIPPKEYNCWYSYQSIDIDGSLEDAAWQKAEWSDQFADITGDPDKTPPLSTRFKMLWDDSCLYIGFEIEESHIWATFTERESVIFHENDVEVFIDPDGDGENYIELEINALGTIWDLLMNKPYNKGGHADSKWNIDGLRSAVALEGTINNPSDRDTQWTVELAIPLKSITDYSKNKKALRSGDSWRMNFSRVEWDLETTDGTYIKMKDAETGEPLHEHNWSWTPQGEVNMHIPESWGHIHFKKGKKKEAVKDAPRFWVWMQANAKKSPADWQNTFQRLSDAGIKGVLMEADTAVMAKAIPVARQFGIEIHAWIWTMNRLEADTSWLSVNRQGRSLARQGAYVNYYHFMCPALPEVKEYLRSLMETLAMTEGLAGIHMDYIRYVDAILPTGLQAKYGIEQKEVLPEFDYGYHPYMRKLYKEQTGIDPMDIENPEQDEQWLQFRLDQLNNTVGLLRNQVRDEGLTISSAVFPTPEMSKKMVRQEWDQWELDYYFPMVYHNFYNKGFDWIKRVVSEDKASVPGNPRIFCGLFVPALANNDDLSKAMQAAFDGGADGIAFFFHGVITDDHLEQIRRFSKKSD